MQKKLYSRHLCNTIDFQITPQYYSLLIGIIENQIANGKDFSAYTPVINYTFWVKDIYFCW
jgi:hypothetical protein